MLNNLLQIKNIYLQQKKNRMNFRMILKETEIPSHTF